MPENPYKSPEAEGKRQNRSRREFVMSAAPGLLGIMLAIACLFFVAAGLHEYVYSARGVYHLWDVFAGFCCGILAAVCFWLALAR